MTKYVLEADGEIIGETLDQGLAEAMFDAAATVYDAVTMYEQEIRTCH